LVVAAPEAKTQLPGKTQPPKTAPKPVSKSSNTIWIGVVAVLLIATVVVVVGLRRRSAARLVEQRRIIAEEQRARRREQIRKRDEDAARQREEQIRQHLAEAQRLVESRQFDEANGELARVDDLDASNAEASELRQKIQVALTPPPSQTSAKAQKPPVTPP